MWIGSKDFFLPDGSHPLEWAYFKDASIIAGQDAAWLDLSCTLTGRLCRSLPHSRPAEHPSGIARNIRGCGRRDATDQLPMAINGSDIPDARSAAYTIPAAQKADSGAYSVRVSAHTLHDQF